MSLPSLNSIGHTVFKLESGNENVDGQMEGQTNGQKTDKRTDGITPIVMMVIYLPVKFEFDWSNRFRVRVRKRKMWTDRRTLRHINLIGGLVTRKRPKNGQTDGITPISKGT